jgi:COP9 signalosome complex subunit 5
MSAIDVQTQTMWQNASPSWTAIVIDPLRSLAKQEPEFGCYRVFPPKYSPPANLCPDGSTNADQASRTTRWGLTYHRYYALPISYFLSQLGGQLLDIMSRNNLWVRVLSSSSLLEVDNRQRVSERVRRVVDRLNSVDSALTHGGGAGRGGGGAYMGGAAAGLGGRGSALGLMAAGGGRGLRGAGADDLEKGSTAGSEIAIEQCKGHATQMVKEMLFDLIMREERRRATAAGGDDEKKQADDGGSRGRHMDVE